MIMKEKKPFKPDFLIVPYALFEDKKIQSLDRDVYAVIYWFEHLKDGVCKAGNDIIAELLNIETRSVQNGLNRLEKQGFIKRVYKDPEKRNRLRIITNISFKKGSKIVRTTKDRRKKSSEPQSIRVRTTEDRASEPQSTRDSNSKRVIKKSILAPQADATKVDLVNVAMESFKVVNPSYSRLYANKTQRAALGRLLKQHGLEKITAIVNYLPKSNAATYAPTITTPLQLENDLGKLLAWGEKQKSQINSKRKEVLV